MVAMELAARALVTAVLVPLAIATAVPAAGPRGDWDDAVDVQERFRTYHVHVPSSYDPAHALPVVLAFHGRGGTGKGMVELTGLSRLADTWGFIVVYPDGVDGAWNDGRARQMGTPARLDDVAFVRALLSELRGRLAIDETRLYATGMSNGAFFLQRLAGALDGEIAAIAPVAGLLTPDIPLPASLPRPVSVLLIIGTADRLVPPRGGRLASGGRGLSTKQTVDVWRSLNGCPSTSRTEQTRNVKKQTWGPCRDSTEVALYVVEGGGHTWPGGAELPPAFFGPTGRELDASAAIVEFFDRHPRRAR